MHDNVVHGNLLTQKQEEEIFKTIKKRQKGKPMTKANMIQFANKIFKEAHLLHNAVLGECWFKNFRGKYHSLSIRKAIPRTVQRVTAEDKAVCKIFIENLEKLVDTELIHPDRIHNIDETPFFWDLVLKKMVVDQNSKHFQKVKEGDHVSIHCFW